MKVSKAAIGWFLSVFFALTLFCCLFTSSVSAGDVLHSVNPTGRTEFSFKDASGAPIAVSLTLLQLDNSYPYRDALLWGGDVGQLPRSVVTGMQIQKNNKTIFIPLSAYSDLGDVKFVSFGAMPHGFRVSLHGGNTATSYDATLFFDGLALIRREVRLRELPEESWERTLYESPSRAEQ